MGTRGGKFHRESTTDNEAQHDCTRASACGEDAWSETASRWRRLPGSTATDYLVLRRPNFSNRPLPTRMPGRLAGSQPEG